MEKISEIEIITICGSMAFAKEMLEIKEKLEKKGYEVIVPARTEEYAIGNIKVESKWEKQELDVIRDYFKKIGESDAILLVNKTKNGIENYIGGNSLIEMAFAHVQDKKIYLLNPIPIMCYSDEIEAMKPKVLNGNLEDRL